MTQTTEQKVKAFAKVVARAQVDTVYRANLISNPMTALKEEGFEVTPGYTMSVMENEGQTQYLPVPASIAMEDEEVFSKLRFGNLLLRAQTDPDFKARLLSQTADVLAENGYTPEAGVQYRAVEGAPKTYYLVLPAQDSGEHELAENELETASGGTWAEVVDVAYRIICQCY